MIKAYYVRHTKSGSSRRNSESWYEVYAPSASLAVTTYLMKMSGSYNAPKSASDVAVRSTRPPLGDIYSLNNEIRFVPVVSRSPLVKKKIKKPTSLPRQQYDLLCRESARIRLPIHYSDDLHKHDKASLSESKPNKFIWIVREMGTHLIPLDTRGKPPAGGDWFLGVVDHNRREFEGGSVRKVYLVDKTKIREITFRAARTMVLKAFPDITK